LTLQPRGQVFVKSVIGFAHLRLSQIHQTRTTYPSRE
jgi:hypothetical protein